MKENRQENPHGWGPAAWIFLGLALVWTLWASGPRWLPHLHLPGAVGVKGRASFGADPVSVSRRRPMPPIFFERMDSGTWSMKDQRGKVVVINFWATWCGPCVREIPFLEGLAERDRLRGLEVVGVALDPVSTAGGRAKVRQFRDAMKMSYPVVLPPLTSEIAAGLEGLPTTILVDRAGRVAQTYVGAVGQEAFKDDVDTLLSETGP